VTVVRTRTASIPSTMAGGHHSRRPSLALPWAGGLRQRRTQACRRPVNNPLTNSGGLWTIQRLEIGGLASSVVRPDP